MVKQNRPVKLLSPLSAACPLLLIVAPSLARVNDRHGGPLAVDRVIVNGQPPSAASACLQPRGLKRILLRPKVLYELTPDHSGGAGGLGPPVHLGVGCPRPRLDAKHSAHEWLWMVCSRLFSGWNPSGSRNRRAFQRPDYRSDLYFDGFGRQSDGGGFAHELLCLRRCFRRWLQTGRGSQRRRHLHAAGYARAEIEHLPVRHQPPAIFPLALAAAIGLEPGEEVQWELLNRGELHLVRPHTPPVSARSKSRKS